MRHDLDLVLDCTVRYTVINYNIRFFFKSQSIFPHSGSNLSFAEPSSVLSVNLLPAGSHPPAHGGRPTPLLVSSASVESQASAPRVRPAIIGQSQHLLSRRKLLFKQPHRGVVHANHGSPFPNPGRNSHCWLASIGAGVNAR